MYYVRWGIPQQQQQQQQQLLRAPFGGGAASPEGFLQNQSFPSPVSDALDAMAGGGLDDLTVGDLDSAAGLHNDMQSSSDVCSLPSI